MLLLENSHLLILCCLVGHIFLHHLFSQPVINLFLLIVKLVEFDLYNKLNTFFWTSLLFLSAKILISPSLTAWFLYSYISLVFCLSRISRSSPFYRFLKALAYCWAWPCIKNILLCSVYLIYLDNFYFSILFCSAFFSSFFLYSFIDLAFTWASLSFSLSCSSFLRFLSSYFCLASSSRAAMMLSFLLLIVSLNSSFFLRLDSLLFSSSSFRCLLTSVNLCCSYSRVISSINPMETYSISCFGLALIFFYSSLISWMSYFFFSISTFSSSFFFYKILLLSSFSSSWIFRFCCNIFSC